MMKKVAAALAAFMLTLGITLAGATPAHAVLSDCPSNRLCLWTNISYGGTLWVFDINTIAQQPGGCLNMTASANNTFTSMWLNVGLVGNTAVRLYDGSNCSAFSVRVYSNAQDPRMDQDMPVIGMHDALSSIKVTY